MNVKDWINSFYKAKGKDLPMTVVGNKLDLCGSEDDQDANAQPSERAVDMAQAKQLAADYNCSYFETSAKDDIGVADLMKEFFEKTLINKKNKTPADPNVPQPFPL